MPQKSILLVVDQSVHDDWKSRANAADLTLSAWIRMRCAEIETPKETMKAAAVNESNGQYYHTGSSNRLTCLCPTCVEYRDRHDIPLGGFK